MGESGKKKEVLVYISKQIVAVIDFYLFFLFNQNKNCFILLLFVCFCFVVMCHFPFL